MDEPFGPPPEDDHERCPICGAALWGNAAILNEAGFNRRRTPHQVQLACASGDSRPVVESHIASLLSRGAGHVRYKGLAGAVLQQGMTVMVHNGAVMVRIRQQHVSKRAQKFRRLLGLKSPKLSEIKCLKN